MAICNDCGQEMLTADGCTLKHILCDDKKVRRQKVGAEGWYSSGQRCGDCGAKYGHYHHPNCDVERCPICGSQLISCGCAITHFVS